ncbi:MAG: PD-(D/E)XK nuclease family protein [Thermoanaerobaculia bacterium]|nr:PD-(D/E)XK nuclease family protein [Thermoanaerobaculia bacterium]
MHLHLGHDFDTPLYTVSGPQKAGELYLGPKKLLLWLESQFGLSGYPENTDYLRIELYRQALLQWEETAPEQPFYSASFDADRFATAEGLLAWRDELLMAGWDFTSVAGCPERLETLAQVEQIFRRKINDPELGAAATGFADRCLQVLHWLTLRNIRLDKISLYEPEALLPAFLRRILAVLRLKKIPLEIVEDVPAAHPDTDLGWLQRSLTRQVNGKKKTAGDASLLILKARRDSDAAVFLAQWLSQNPGWKPVFLIPEMNRTLEQALLLEGFPALGVLSSSLARPSLQVLKLAPVFLWEPVDVFKIMEFVTLPVKPLDDGLALEIARVMAEKPGLFSDTWFGAVLGYLDKAGVDPEAREQYEFWFSRRRYRAEGTAPKRDALELYDYLQRWARKVYEDTKNATLLVLAEQARRIRDLLETLPEQRLGFLELERIVRTIYEPAPVQITQAETGRFDYVHQPGALTAPAEMLIWWNCLFDGRIPKPDPWRREERAWLASRLVVPDEPMLESRRALLLGQRPVLRASQQLLLIIPEQADGAEVLPSLLLSDVEAAFDTIHPFTFSLDDEAGRQALMRLGVVPRGIRLESRIIARPRPQLLINQPERLIENEYETPTNLESLFYYPHRWFFRQKLRLFPASLLSVTRDQTLLGSLAHRFFELLLQENALDWDKNAVRDWIDEKAGSLLEREGATLLLYGREPERNQFLNRVKNAAWNLLDQIRNNGWSIAGTEQELRGEFAGVPVRGKADLVLCRDTGEWAIVDLKWSGARRRKEMIRNGEDLQLILYARLLPPPENWAHTAYFILEEGKMIARNRTAFRDAITASGDEDHGEVCAQIFARMERTYAWRLAQLQKGILELRTARTAPELDALYADELIDLLEMKLEDSRWDDYKTLLGFME